MKKKQRKTKMCDPGMCDECIYIGDGDFLCDKYQAFVVEDWEAGDDYLICQGKGNKE